MCVCVQLLSHVQLFATPWTHSPEYPKRFTALGREEKGEGGDRGDLGEKKESQKGREQSSHQSHS